MASQHPPFLDTRRAEPLDAGFSGISPLRSRLDAQSIGPGIRLRLATRAGPRVAPHVGLRLYPRVAEAGAQPESRVEGVIEAVRSSQRLAADEPLGAETFLIERGLALDSVALLDLVLALEECFGLRIDEKDVVAENFETIACVARLIDRIASDA
jgi:acyl carrier protein